MPYAPGPHIAVAGTTGAGDDIATQAREALSPHREGAWPEAGAALADVVRTRMFVTDIGLWRMSAPCTRKCSASVRPVATMVEVSALIAPDLLVEIEVDAYVAEGTDEPSNRANRPSSSGR